MSRERKDPAVTWVEQKGTTVKFAAWSTESWGQNWADWALTLGFYGSPMRPGSLDGQRATPCY